MNATILNIFVAYATLLPGDPTDCLDPAEAFSDDTCSGGAASVAAVIRHSEKRGDGGPSFYIPILDRLTKFVQMHPSKMGANKLISHDHFGWNAFIPSPSIFTDYNADFSELQTHQFSPVLTNQAVPSTSHWAPFVERVHFDHATGASFILLTGESKSLTAPAVESLVAALDYVAKLNTDSGCDDNNSGTPDVETEINEKTSRCWLPPIVYLDLEDDLLNDCIETALNHDHPPLMFYDNLGDTFPPKIMKNGKTVAVTIPKDDEIVSHLRIEIGRGEMDEKFVKSVNLTETNIEELPAEFKDEDYVKDHLFLRSLADEAIQNDPVVGTTGFMPMTRVENWRKCMGGECPIGNLFTDALRWAGEADFAVTNSGGLRGPGWAEGEVRVSDLWTTLPFTNYLCTGVMSGVSVFRLLKLSTSLATFESTYTDLGDRLLQMSGARMSYNTLLDGARLLSVDIWDTEAQDFLPLERLKMYKFATDDWMCEHWDQFSSLFGSDLQIEGEIPGTLDKSRILQEIVAAYLTGLNETYDTSIRGSHVNDTNSFTPMKFIQTEDSCAADYFWEPTKLSCLPCPGGKYVQFSDDITSFLFMPDSQDFGGRNVLFNRELVDVTPALKSAPKWVVFRNSTDDLVAGSTVLQPGESVAVEFDIDASYLAKGSTRSTVSFGIVLDGDYPGCLTPDITFDALVELRSEENLNQINNIRPVGLTLMAIALSLALFFIAWTQKHRKKQVVKASQPIFMQLICVGTFIMASSIIPLSIDDSMTSQEGASIACMASPWLLSMGFSITFSALFAKLWRIHKIIFASMSMRNVKVTERDALVPIFVVFVINFVVLLCWTLIDPLKWQREFINPDDPTNSYGFCKSEGKASIAFITLIALVNCAALVLACERAYRARKMGNTYTESRWVFAACASWIQAFAIGIPVILLTRDKPVAFYFTHVTLVFLVCVSMLLFMFLPKMERMSRIPTFLRSSANTATSTVAQSALNFGRAAQSVPNLGRAAQSTPNLERARTVRFSHRPRPRFSFHRS